MRSLVASHAVLSLKIFPLSNKLSLQVPVDELDQDLAALLKHGFSLNVKVDVRSKTVAMSVHEKMVRAEAPLLYLATS